MGRSFHCRKCQHRFFPLSLFLYSSLPKRFVFFLLLRFLCCLLLILSLLKAYCLLANYWLCFSFHSLFFLCNVQCSLNSQFLMKPGLFYSLQTVHVNKHCIIFFFSLRHFKSSLQICQASRWKHSNCVLKSEKTNVHSKF